MNNNEFVESLRTLADYYEKNPELPLPDFGQFPTITIYSVEGLDEMARVGRIFGSFDKVDAVTGMITIQRQVGGFTLRALDYRDRVCTKQVVGTRVVEKTRPVSPEMETYFEEEEIVEWECPSLLAQGGEKEVRENVE